MNKIFIIGNLVKNAEIISLETGTQLTKFTVAVNRKFRKPDGTVDTDFFNCTAYGKLGTDVIAKYGSKGQKVSILGRIESNTTENAEGSKNTYWNVIVEEFELFGAKKEENDKEKDDDKNIPF